jgi:hypothetical protein
MSPAPETRLWRLGLLACGLTFELAARLANVAAALPSARLEPQQFLPRRLWVPSVSNIRIATSKSKSDTLASCVEEEKRKEAGCFHQWLFRPAARGACEVSAKGENLWRSY